MIAMLKDEDILWTLWEGCEMEPLASISCESQICQFLAKHLDSERDEFRRDLSSSLHLAAGHRFLLSMYAFSSSSFVG